MFPAIQANNSTTVLVDLWNKEMARAIDEQPLLHCRAKVAPWFSGELHAMK